MLEEALGPFCMRAPGSHEEQEGNGANLLTAESRFYTRTWFEDWVKDFIFFIAHGVKQPINCAIKHHCLEKP